MAANHVESDISSLEIQDKTLTQGVHTVFSPRNNFLAYGVQRGKSRKDWGPQYLHEISSKSALYNKHVRKLVNESHGVFLSLNNTVQEFTDGKKNLEISKISQKYRSVLLACIEDLDLGVESSNDEESSELRAMFADIELIWHLLQSLIIDSQSGSRVVYKLLEWIKWHFMMPEKKLHEITTSESAASHPDYWDTILQFILQGKVTSARSLLQMHPKFEREDYASLDELLRKMPMYFSTCGMSLNEFRIRWKHWQDESKGRLLRGDYSSDPNLETVCKILCGDSNMLTEKSYLCVNWYHLMISVQLYTDPCINLSALGDTARIFYNNINSAEWSKLTVVDSIILAAMELDIVNVINLSCTFNDGWWFAVHMMDLLTHGNYIEDPKHNYPHHYRNHLLMNYAEALMSHSSLWEIGISYLDHCQENNRELLELYLERIPLKTEAKARKIIHIAKQRNMDSLVKTISNVMMSKAMINGKLGSAMSWVMYSKDVKFADELADRWMKDYADNRKIECFEILHNMGSCMLVSDKLTFVGKYCEFHKLYSERKCKEAATLLISLMSSGIATPNFQMIMLLDALPLLESSELIFSSKDTYQLMNCLEEIVSSSRKKINEPLENDDKESLIRLALVRNLARSFVLEPVDSEPEDGF